MEYKEILNYAIKGLGYELEKVDKSLRRGRKLIEQYNRGETLKTDLTIYEIKEVCSKKVTEIEELEKKRNELLWELAEIEDNEQKK